jgi:S-methylmethionine-dependent homocysteine/selenocysteine methylase
MALYRTSLPQASGALFLTDGGIETTLIFHEGLNLPDFAAFHLLRTPEGEAALRKYFQTYIDVAKAAGTGIVLESATWRASADWGTKLGYTRDALAEANRKAIALLEELRSEHATEQTPIVVSGCVGPRGDGYVPDTAMSAAEAAAYHRDQIETFAGTAADMICAITMNYADEAAGVALAARNARMPVALSFTVETDGRLPTGQPLKEAIEQVDAATAQYPAYYMINCAHPTHFEGVLDADAPWTQRIRGLRANASRMSHAELNESPTLDSGNPEELGGDYARLRQRLTQLNVMGGCCGTDHRHIEQIARACAPLFR